MHEYLCYQSGQMPDEFDYNKDTSKYFIVLPVKTISFDKIVKTKSALQSNSQSSCSSKIILRRQMNLVSFFKLMQNEKNNDRCKRVQKRSK